MIPTYVINLKSRTDRKNNVLKVFKDSTIFDVKIHEAIKNDIGALGIWLSIKSIIKEADNKNYSYVLICEDDHVFTDSYDETEFMSILERAKKYDFDILSGGISSLIGFSFPVEEDLIIAESFTGFQFTLISSKIFNKILNANFDPNIHAADILLSSLSEINIVIHPFISIQKEFGYSDATPFYNGREGYISNLFIAADLSLKLIKDVFRSYSLPIMNKKKLNPMPLPVYILNKDNSEENFESRFRDRNEFKIQDIFNYHNSKSESDALLQIFKSALEKKHEFIILCNSNHFFANDYNYITFYKAIIEAKHRNANILLGNVIKGKYIVPSTEYLFVGNFEFHHQFVVIYKNSFKRSIKIINSSEENFITNLSQKLYSKFAIQPFVSENIENNEFNISLAKGSKLFSKFKTNN